ncbi:MAG: hypothetical protein AAGI91_00750 [Bacteroidota bacterium]
MAAGGAAMTLAVLALVASLSAADTTQRALPDPGRQVVTRAEIEAAGLYRLPDLFRLIDGMRTATVDGFTWRTSFGGAEPFGAETWTLLVDGERIEMGLFGEQNLSLVPVAVTQVDSVEVWTQPRLVAGTLAHGGVLHIHTTRTERGGAARGGVAIGNEIGDPGPFRYVPELASRNVDKFGADYEARAGYGAPLWRAQARFKLLRFYATDFAAFDRNLDALGANPALRLLAPALRVEADALGGTHALSLLGGGANDLWFFQPLGREIPVRRLWGQAGLHGRVPIAARTTLGYRLALAEDRLDAWDGAALGLDPNWQRRTLRAGLDGQRRFGGYTATLGGEVRRVTSDAVEGFTLGTVTGQVVRTVAGQRQHLDAALAVAGGEVGASAVLGTRHAVGQWTLGAAAALTQRLPEEQPRFSFWQVRGFDAFDATVDVRQPAGLERTTELSLHLDAIARPVPSLTLETHAVVRSVHGLTVEAQPTAPDPDAFDSPRLLLVAPDETGLTAGGRVAVRWERSGRRVRLHWDGQGPVGGDAFFQRAWEAVPAHRFGADAALTVESFTVAGALIHRTSARWPAYAPPFVNAGSGLYDATVPAAWLLDASLEKWLWQRRLRGSLLFRNLLNQEERYHPVGAALDLRFYLRLEVNL